VPTAPERAANATAAPATPKRQKPPRSPLLRGITTREKTMEWNTMKVVITNENDEIFAEHELGPMAASELHEFIDHAKDGIQDDDEHVVEELLHSLESAADNVRRGAVTDDTNIILSERDC
jgi:hypothetical protein